MAGVFQPNVFQNNVFQVGELGPVQLLLRTLTSEQLAMVAVKHEQLALRTLGALAQF